jgi:hypothetical protein
MEKKHLRKKEEFIKFLIGNHYHFKFIMEDGGEESDYTLFDDISKFLRKNPIDEITDKELDEDTEMDSLPDFDTNKDDAYSYYDEDDNDERYEKLYNDSKKINRIKEYVDEYKDVYYNLGNIKNIEILEENYDINFTKIVSIPDGVVFRNKGNLVIPDIYKIPDNTEFRNDGHVYMEYIKKIGENVLFENEDKVHIRFLSIGGNTVEMQPEDLLDGILESIGSYNPYAKDTMSNLRELKGIGIDGISMSRILNKTISQINNN